MATGRMGSSNNSRKGGLGEGGEGGGEEGPKEGTKTAGGGHVVGNAGGRVMKKTGGARGKGDEWEVVIGRGGGKEN